jgi:pimeloyl-ACP methyl ester carboxylesterase
MPPSSAEKTVVTPDVADRAAAAAGPTWLPQTGYVPVEGGALFYAVDGPPNPPTVFLHAAGQTHAMWNPQVPDFAPYTRATRYDLRGFGQSTPPSGPFSRVGDLGSVLEHLRVGKAPLVGLSMGAGVAASYAVLNPRRVERLVIASVSGPPPGVPAFPDEIDFTTPQGRERLRDLHVPTLVLVGENAPVAVQTLATQIEALVPRAWRVVIPKAAHLLNLEQPELFNKLVVSFLYRGLIPKAG